MSFFAYQAPSEQIPLADRKWWTQKECDALEAFAILEAGRYELLDGKIVCKEPRSVKLARTAKRVMFGLIALFGETYVSLPCAVSFSDENCTEPDMMVMRRTDNEYTAEYYKSHNNPGPQEIRLLLEVSDATLWRDRNTKMVLYAQAGVPEYWVLDVNGRTLWVHRNPTPTGHSDIQAYDETQSITPLTAPTGSAPITVASLLP